MLAIARALSPFVFGKNRSECSVPSADDGWHACMRHGAESEAPSTSTSVLLVYY